MLSSTLFLLLWCVAGGLSATPTPLPASGPGVPSPDVGDPGIALLVLVATLLTLAGIILITVGVRSARANERAEDEAQKRLIQAERPPEPGSPDEDSADSRAGRMVSE